MAIACLHLFSGYLDAIKYRGSVVFNLSEVFYYLLAYQGWAIFSFTFFSLLERYWTQFSTLSLVFIWSGVAILWLFVYFSLDSALMMLLSSSNTTWSTLLFNISNAVIFFYFILYCVTTAACLAIFYYRSSQMALINALKLEKKQADSELKLTEMQLEQLQSRLSPHFLFNCLSSLSALARSDNKEALISAIAQMGNLLRFCVSNSSERYIALSQELDFVDDYLALQRLRYPAAFQFKKQITPDIKAVLCPPFLLQPLIENAFTHGVDTTQALTQIELRVNRSGSDLIIEIVNTKSQNNELNTGLNSAIKNVKNRLQILYPSHYDMAIDNAARHFTVTVQIPAVIPEDLDNE
jgi:sensor histidine kinase YesM